MRTTIIIAYSIQPLHHEQDSYIIVAFSKIGSDRIIKHNNHGTAI